MFLVHCVILIVTLFAIRIFALLFLKRNISKHIGPAKTLIVLGSGGHTTEMFKILHELNRDNYKPRIYIAADSDKGSHSKVTDFEATTSNDYKFIKIFRSRSVGQSYVSSVFTTLQAIVSSIPVIYHERPDLVMCNGPVLKIHTKDTSDRPPPPTTNFVNSPTMDPDSESTATDDGNTENFCDNPTRDILADGIISMFRPCVDQLQERVKATRIAQYELKQLLENLTMKLKVIEKSQQTPVILDDYLKKMINVKHKVTVVYNVLNNAQDRLNSIYKQIETEKIKGRALLDDKEGR